MDGEGGRIVNPIKQAWRWFTLKDLHTEALDKMLPAGHNAWISVFKEDGAESYSACCGEHLMTGLKSFRQDLNEKEEEEC